jgi:hypothetical protein
LHKAAINAQLLVYQNFAAAQQTIYQGQLSGVQFYKTLATSGLL